MKRIITICAAILTAACILLLVACREIDITKGNFTQGVSVYQGNGATEVPIGEHDPILTKLKNWLQAPDATWQLSLTTYAPKLVVHGSHFTLNFFDGVAVLNFREDPSHTKWIQVVRKYDASSLPLVEELRSKVEKASKANTSSQAHPGT